jgi:hypothetical protein
MDMERLSFENVDITKINRKLGLETRFNLDSRKHEA